MQFSLPPLAAAALLIAGFLLGPAATLAAEAPAGAGTPHPTAEVIVNGEALGLQQQLDLARLVGRPVAPGRYWYDTVSGLWGYEGGPAAGQLPPKLAPISAPLQADASGAMTPVYINGRSLHPTEVQQLYLLLGQVIPGRYIMNERWQIAVEGGSFAVPLVDLGALAASAQRSVQGPATRWFGARDTGNSIYLPEAGGRAGGTSVGTASDGCTYVVSGDYSAEVCN
jgi:hypothetical protein